uniref:Uncharacterized protein n=1 Tax=Romanomermis culicivorax TaxID=13658 RepID=A0A915JKX3_ROMCU
MKKVTRKKKQDGESSKDERKNNVKKEVIRRIEKDKKGKCGESVITFFIARLESPSWEFAHLVAQLGIRPFGRSIDNHLIGNSLTWAFAHTAIAIENLSVENRSLGNRPSQGTQTLEGGHKRAGQWSAEAIGPRLSTSLFGFSGSLLRVLNPYLCEFMK